MPSAFKPQVGVFWFVAPGTAPSPRLVSLLSPIDVAAAGRDLVATPYGHLAAWQQLQASDESLVPYAYDHFPRGRLEYFGPTRRWIFSLDRQLKRSRFISLLVLAAGLPPGHVTAQVDLAYTSAVAIREPKLTASDADIGIRYFAYLDQNAPLAGASD
jgi:hypothetical protein